MRSDCGRVAQQPIASSFATSEYLQRLGRPRPGPFACADRSVAYLSTPFDEMQALLLQPLLTRFPPTPGVLWIGLFENKVPQALIFSGTGEN